MSEAVEPGVEMRQVPAPEWAGAEPLVFIEVQRGEYFGEDDIERLEDDFGRV